MYVFRNKVYRSSEEADNIVFGKQLKFPIGPAPEFGGKEGLLSPEDMFVGAVNSCLMMTFFYFLKKADIEILSYESEAEGSVEKGKEGLRFTNVNVSAKVIIRSSEMIEKVKNFGSLAEKYCLVSKSLSCPVTYKLEVEIG